MHRGERSQRQKERKPIEATVFTDLIRLCIITRKAAAMDGSARPGELRASCFERINQTQEIFEHELDETNATMHKLHLEQQRIAAMHYNYFNFSALQIQQLFRGAASERCASGAIFQHILWTHSVVKYWRSLVPEPEPIYTSALEGLGDATEEASSANDTGDEDQVDLLELNLQLSVATVARKNATLDRPKLKTPPEKALSREELRRKQQAYTQRVSEENSKHEAARAVLLEKQKEAARLAELERKRFEDEQRRLRTMHADALREDLERRGLLAVKELQSKKDEELRKQEEAKLRLAEAQQKIAAQVLSDETQQILKREQRSRNNNNSNKYRIPLRLSVYLLPILDRDDIGHESVDEQHPESDRDGIPHGSALLARGAHLLGLELLLGQHRRQHDAEQVDGVVYRGGRDEHAPGVSRVREHLGLADVRADALAERGRERVRRDVREPLEREEQPDGHALAAELSDLGRRQHGEELEQALGHLQQRREHQEVPLVAVPAVDRGQRERHAAEHVEAHGDDHETLPRSVDKEAPPCHDAQHDARVLCHLDVQRLLGRDAGPHGHGVPQVLVVEPQDDHDAAHEPDHAVDHLLLAEVEELPDALGKQAHSAGDLIEGLRVGRVAVLLIVLVQWNVHEHPLLPEKEQHDRERDDAAYREHDASLTHGDRGAQRLALVRAHEEHFGREELREQRREVEEEHVHGLQVTAHVERLSLRELDRHRERHHVRDLEAQAADDRERDVKHCELLRVRLEVGRRDGFPRFVRVHEQQDLAWREQRDDHDAHEHEEAREPAQHHVRLAPVPTNGHAVRQEPHKHRERRGPLEQVPRRQKLVPVVQTQVRDEQRPEHVAQERDREARREAVERERAVRAAEELHGLEALTQTAAAALGVVVDNLALLLMPVALVSIARCPPRVDDRDGFKVETLVALGGHDVRQVALLTAAVQHGHAVQRRLVRGARGRVQAPVGGERRHGHGRGRQWRQLGALLLVLGIVLGIVLRHGDH